MPLSVKLLIAEFAFLPLAAGLIWVFPPPGEAMRWAISWQGLAWTIVFFAPLWACVWMVQPSVRRAIPGVASIYNALANGPLGELIRHGSTGLFFMLSLMAGIGEELLMRGFFQPHFGLLITAAIFGLCHALTPAYFIFSAIFCLYLGVLYEYTSQMLVIPIAIHSGYDFMMLCVYRRQFRREAVVDTEASDQSV